MLIKCLIPVFGLCIAVTVSASPASESQAITTIQTSGSATSQYLSFSAVYATTAAGKPGLKFTIKNISGSTLHVNAATLPWSWPHGLNAVVGAWRWGDQLEPAPPPPPFHQTGGPAYVNLKPGTSLEGIAPLDEYVMHFDQARKKGEVIIMWWTEVWDDQKRLGKFGGWVDFPKTTPGDVQ